MNEEPKDPIEELNDVLDEMRILSSALTGNDSGRIDGVLAWKADKIAHQLRDVLEQLADVKLKEMSEVRP